VNNTPHFDLRRLKYAATINDEALSEETAPDFELEYVDIGNVDSSGQIHQTATYRFEAAPSRARRKVRDGDVIISTVRTYLQAIAPIEAAPDNLIVSTGFAVVRPSPQKLDPHFCKYALREPDFLAEVERRSVGVSYPAVNASELGDIEIPLPSLPQQHAIADFLDREIARLDLLVAEKERLLELLAEKRRALITHAVTRGLNTAAPLRDSGLPWLGEIPSHWPLLRAKYLWREASIQVRDDDEMVTCFRDGQVTLRKNRREEGFTNAVKELGYQGIRAGQLVLHSMDAFAGAIGVSDSDGRCTPEYIICDALRADVHNPYYGLLLRSMALNGFIQAMCAAVRERAPRIHFSDFGDMFFPVPPLDEQRAIVAHIAAEMAKLDALRAAAEQTMALLKERRAALIAAAVTGQVNVPLNPLPLQEREGLC
jgi:type I restriction enzyme S subunit